MGGDDHFWSKLARRSQSNLYFALIFLPADRREAFRDVYRFLRAADDASDTGRDPDVARAELALFRRELAAVYEGRARHPLAERLERAVHAHALSRAHFERIFDALDADAAPRRFASYAELERWCEDLSGTLGLLSLEILGIRGAAAQTYARELGIALQLANIVRDVADDARTGRLYLPLDRLAAAGCTPESVLAGRYSPAFAEVATGLDRNARELVIRARARLGAAERRALLVPEIWGDVYLALLGELAGARYDVFGRRPRLSRRKKLLLAARRFLADEGARVADRWFHPAS